ncbi:Modifier of rudimentary, Modr [Cordyceps fumosorosea ARSEF 2679]|uniref:Modifier of rudimentary, Modr n=1 Tax=Cordyceps fumosorosea (strain ARSEF 2679) TaxID=1081104 RepID=A0A167WKR9_CORFA|nr:Modifier of rudimentary, Modr [Cordyceps fumosorosea ARSEF 2679]OAA63914.1 Modifier of rudimentary, Modr [Cordyceps fumosorosea ARSEF 2679]
MSGYDQAARPPPPPPKPDSHEASRMATPTTGGNSVPPPPPPPPGYGTRRRRAAAAGRAARHARLGALGRRLSGAREATQARLLATHALERQWRQRQSDMDHALAPFSPAALYQALAHGVQEQAQVCQAMEDSFLDGGRGDGGGGGGGEGGELLTEREVAEWVKGYREAKVLYYQRQERKERWDEGRVGGWR